MDTHDKLSAIRKQLAEMVAGNSPDMKLNCLFSTDNFTGGEIFYTSNTVRTELECAIENLDEALAVLKRCGYGEGVATAEDIATMAGDDRAKLEREYAV